MADPLYTTAKIIHVLLAASWVGGALFNFTVVQKALAQATPETRREFGGRVVPPVLKYFNITGGLTLASGLVLVQVHPRGWDGISDSTWGRLVLFGLIAGLLVLYLANFAIRPTFKAIMKIQSTMEPGAVMPANLRFMMLRLRFSSALNILILIAVVATMVGANVAYFSP